MNGINDRISNIIEISGLTKKDFSKKLGITAVGLNNYINNNRIPSTEILIKIKQLFNNISIDWLLTGEGEMLKTSTDNDYSIHHISLHRKTNDPIREIQEVPLYDLEATAGLIELFKETSSEAILDRIRIPGIAKCDGGVYVKGDSMYPLLKSGDIILFKKIDIDRIFWGEMYLISAKITEWEEYITVKFVQKSELGSKYVKLVSQNQHHQPKDILIKDISALALIRASIILHSS